MALYCFMPDRKIAAIQILLMITKPAIISSRYSTDCSGNAQTAQPTPMAPASPVESNATAW
ncbi:hypothetical protein D3C87_1177470 [compost metagenome]